MNKKENTVLFRIGNAVTRFAQRFMPDAYLFALLLTALVFLLGILVAGQTPMNMIVYFHKNIWSLLEFGMQLCLMLVLSTVSVGTRPISHLMKKIASIPKTPGQAIVFGSFIMLVLFSVNSTFALVFGAIYAKETARCLKNMHYPLLVAVCYCGYITWQGGLGGTTPLLMATEGSWASELLGHTIPLMDIILSPLNLTLLILMIVTIPVLAALLVPRQQKDIITVDASVFTDETMPIFRCPAQATFAQKLEYSRIPTLLFGIFISVYIVSQFGTRGIKALDINMLNLVLLALSLLFVDNAMDLLSRVSGAAKITSGVIIQFPIYAGIMGMVSGSGLGQMISKDVYKRQVLDDDMAAACGVHVGQEVVRVATAMGIELPILVKGYDFYDLDFKNDAGRKRAVEWLRGYCNAQRGAKASMLQDMEKGIHCEIDFINGEACKYGSRNGIGTPFNDTLVHIIKEFEAGNAAFPTKANLNRFTIPNLS